MLNANSSGDKIFQGVQIYQKCLFQGFKYLNKIEINYPRVQIFDIFGPGELIMGVHFSHDGTILEKLLILA